MRMLHRAAAGSSIANGAVDRSLTSSGLVVRVLARRNEAAFGRFGPSAVQTRGESSCVICEWCFDEDNGPVDLEFLQSLEG